MTELRSVYLAGNALASLPTAGLVSQYRAEGNAVDERVYEEGFPNLSQKARVGLSERPERPIRVYLRTDNGSATKGADFEDRELVLDLSGGTPFNPPVARPAVVNITEDGAPEGDETFSVIIDRAVFLNDDGSEGEVFIDTDTIFHTAEMTITDPPLPVPVDVFIELAPPGGGTVRTTGGHRTLTAALSEDEGGAELTDTPSA